MKNIAYYLYRPHQFFDKFYPGKELNLISDTAIYAKYFHDSWQPALVQKYFPDGLTPHGLSMLQNYPMSAPLVEEPIVEFIFELVRQKDFPGAPSRFTSLYASPTLIQAERWRDKFQSTQAAESLWEIEYGTEAKLYDATLLEAMPEIGTDFGKDKAFSYFWLMEKARQYWRGILSPFFLPELLIPFPVTVLREIIN